MPRHTDHAIAEPPMSHRSTLLKSFIAFALLATTSMSVIADVTVDGDSPPAVTGHTTGHVHTVSPYFLGQNESQFCRKIGTIPSFDPLIEQTSKLIRELHLGHLRGPGGTGSSWYRYRTGEMIQPDSPDVLDYFPEDAIPRHKRRNTIADGYPGIFPHQFTKPARDNGIAYVYAANPIIDSDDDLVDLAMLLRTLTPGPTFLEMGNEYYGRYAKKAFPDPADYLAKVKRVRDRIKALDPSIRVGALMPSPALTLRAQRFADQHNPEQDGEFEGTPAHRHLRFVEVIAEAEDAYDAVITHTYTSIRVLDGLTVDTLMQYLFGFQELEQQLFADHPIPEGTPIWVTEWGVLNWAMFREKDLELKAKYQFYKSVGVALVEMDWLLRMIDMEDITISSHHGLIGGQGFALVQNWGDETIRLPNYYVHRAIGEVLAEHPAYHRIETASPSRVVAVEPHRDMLAFADFDIEAPTVDLKHVGLWGFGDEQNLNVVVAINRSEMPQRVSLPGHTLAKYWTYGGGDPLPGFMKAKVRWTHPPEFVPKPDTTAHDPAETVTLAPYSMTLLTASPAASP